MNIDNVDWQEKILIIRNKQLEDFLKLRPDTEDLGESLDLYRKILVDSNQLDKETDKLIRAIHIRHRGQLLQKNGIPLTIYKPQNRSDKIEDFCTKFESIKDKNKNDFFDFIKSYNYISDIYICHKIVEYLYSIKEFDSTCLLFENSIHKIFSFSEKTWNEKESCYGIAIFAFRILELLENRNMDDNEKQVIIKLVNITYLFLSRVIMWPEESDLFKRTKFDLPISFEHRICCLLKRADLLGRFGYFFPALIPDLSTTETLIVSDYYMAHELSFALQTLGRASQFKRDARDKYKLIKDSNIRPYSTCIRDGKKDSVELAHRFYLKYESGEYMLNEEQKSFLIKAIKEGLKGIVRNEPLKDDSEQIAKYLKSKNITCLYHFTERDNYDSIKESGGLFSQRACLEHSIIPQTSGEMRHLRSKDAKLYLEDYVRLSFCENHPLIRGRKSELILFKIKPEIALLESTLFSDRDAALENHHHGAHLEDLAMVHFDVLAKKEISEDDPDYDFYQAEVMVKTFLPKEYILNFDNPEII